MFAYTFKTPLMTYLASERAQNRSWPLDKAMQRISDEGGVLVLLANHESNDSLIAQVRAFELEDKGEKPVTAKWQGTSRRVGVGSQILADVRHSQNEFIKLGETLSRTVRFWP